MTDTSHAAPRFCHLGLPGCAAVLVVPGLVVSSLAATAPVTDKLARGATRLFSPAGLSTQMFPPDFSRAEPIGWKLQETLRMAVAGCTLGTIFAVPFAILATERLSSGAVIAHCRTLPDRIWAIRVEKVGVGGRFLAEAMEKTDPGPMDAPRAIGASHLWVIVSSVFPACLPSFTSTSLFSLEKLLWGCAALGLVGAGGIRVAFDLFNHDEALAIILLMFALIIAVEQGSGWIPRKLI